MAVQALSLNGGQSLVGTKRYRTPVSHVRSMDVAAPSEPNGPAVNGVPVTSTLAGRFGPFQIDSTRTLDLRLESLVNTTVPAKATGADCSRAGRACGGMQETAAGVAAPRVITTASTGTAASDPRSRITGE